MKPYLITALFMMVLSGCALQDTRSLSPRENAALQLTQEGRHLLSAGETDNAIRLFEQAIGLNPNDGECYYYLAEAWLAKGSLSEAKEFNNLARDYLKNDPLWVNRVIQQKDRIEGMSK